MWSLCAAALVPSVPAVLAAACAVPLPAQEAGAVLGGDFEVVSGDGKVVVTCLGKEAAYTHRLVLHNTDRFICDSGDTGRKVELGSFPAGTVLVFRLDVEQTGSRFFTGPAARNPDGVVHARMTDAGAAGWHFGFEDLWGGGDRDYDDCLFLVSGVTAVAPEEESAEEP